MIILVDETMLAKQMMPEELALDFTDADFINDTRSYFSKRPVALIATLSDSMQAILLNSDIPYFKILAARTSDKNKDVLDENGDVIGKTHTYIKPLLAGSYINYQDDVPSDPLDPESDLVRPTIEAVAHSFAGHDAWVFESA